MIKTYAAPALATALLTGPAAAQELTIFNHSTVDVVAIHGNPARIEEFRPIIAGGNGSFFVAMPEGQCETLLDISFADGSRTEAMANVCLGLALRLTEGF